MPAEPNTGSPKPRTADPGPSYADEDLPVPADFEAKADEEITSDNYEEVLAELKAELDDKPDGGAPDAAPKPTATSAASPPRPPPTKSTATVKPKSLPPPSPAKTP